jgi:hypothetical protein
MGKTSGWAVRALAGLAVAATACASSPGGSQPGASTTIDAAGDDGAALSAVTVTPGTSGAPCSPLTDGGTCDVGLTCCVDTGGILGLLMNASSGFGGVGGTLSSLTTDLGTCIAPSACTSTFQYECFPSGGVVEGCAPSQVCCAGVVGDAGALLSLASTGDASFAPDADLAESTATDGGQSAIAALLSGGQGFSIQSSCQAACPSSQNQLCATNADCQGNAANPLCGGLGTCQPADAGAFMEASAPPADAAMETSLPAADAGAEGGSPNDAATTE